MNYVVAVSGGVDSVVLLDMMARHRDKNRIIVAHFDHGIREESAADARFVRALSQRYHLPFEAQREELGENASEALARERRYIFLRQLAKRYDAKIVTAHHQDDLIETIAINLVRGTGWRGLSVFAGNDIIRPLVIKQKGELYDYALSHQLEWVEDITNQSDKYLRNRLRRRTTELSFEITASLLKLRQQQIFLRHHIEHELRRHAANQSRYFLTMLPEKVALEILRTQTNEALTRPQLIKLLQSIKTAQVSTTLEAGASVKVRFTKTHYTFENTSQLLY